MNPVRSRLRRLVPPLLALAAVALGRFLGSDPPGVAANPAAFANAAAPASLDLAVVDSASHRDQIASVVDSMDRTGAPPDGVAQGGRGGSTRGQFQNAEGRLPRKGSGYWRESDVWPRHGARDAERLIFGREGEVYWTRDHYSTFVRLR